MPSAKTSLMWLQASEIHLASLGHSICIPMLTKERERAWLWTARRDEVTLTDVRRETRMLYHYDNHHQTVLTSRSSVEKLRVVQLVRKFQVFYRMTCSQQLPPKKNSPPNDKFSHVNLVHSLPPSSLKIYYRIVFPSMFRSSECSLPFRFLSKIHFSSLPCVPHIQMSSFSLIS
jgi:hypothetical protein